MKKKPVKEKEVPVKDDDSFPFNVYFLYSLIPVIVLGITLLVRAFGRSL